MNIFRTIAAKAPRTRRELVEPVMESGPEPAPQVQRPPPAATDGPTKADEMIRLMAERRKRLKEAR